MPLTDHDLGGLSREQRRELDQCASRLKQILLGGATAVDLRRLLPPREAPHRLAVLCELIKTELAIRYDRGQRCRLEEFTRRYPELGGPENLPARLVYEEYRVRDRAGDHPALDEYRTRFPRQFGRLEDLVRNPPPASEEPPEVASALTYTTLNSPPMPPDLLLPEIRAGASRPPSAARASQPAIGGSGQRLPLSEGYQLIEKIGQGQFGEVFRALAPGGIPVAVKRILRTMDDECSRRELVALERIRELRHPFLLQTFAFQALEDRLMIVMELADGSLHDRFKECRAAGLPGVPADELLRYFAEAAEALDYLHEKRLTHRDIKPHNLLHLQGHAKVADLGIARLQQGQVDITHNVGGTPAYMGPEMWRGEVSVHSDQYSFAVTWYEMRTGRRIFSGQNQFEIMRQQMTEAPDVSGVPEAEQKVLLRALDSDPNGRYPTCLAFVEALKEALTPPKRVEPPVTPSGGNRPLRLAAWAVTVAVVAAVLLYVVLVIIPKGPVDDKKQPRVEANWLPPDWEPVDPNDQLQVDSRGLRYYPRLRRDFAGQTVHMILVPQKRSSDPLTFYIMENKVWNDLYRAFVNDPESGRLLTTWGTGQGREVLIKNKWTEGAVARDEQGRQIKLGVEGNRGRVPVFRVTATEAFCVAGWMNGKLPTLDEYYRAAALDEFPRPPIYEMSGVQGLALCLLNEGPWSVDRGDLDVIGLGCRQLVTNGKEFTRNLADENGFLPLRAVNGEPSVQVVGKSYTSCQPPTPDDLKRADTQPCTDPSEFISFRVVLEQ